MYVLKLVIIIFTKIMVFKIGVVKQSNAALEGIIFPFSLTWPYLFCFEFLDHPAKEDELPISDQTQQMEIST